MKTFVLGFLILLLFSAPISAQLPEQLGTITCDTINTWLGYEIMPAGDINCDGFSDFLAWDFRGKSYLYLGGPTVPTAPALTFENTTLYGSEIPDFNGDSCPEFILTGSNANDHQANWYNGGPALDTIADRWFGLDTLYIEYNATFCHDLNGNGTDEILGLATSQKSLIGFELGPTDDSVPDFRLYPSGALPGYYFGEGLAVGDFNDDGKEDLAVSLRQYRQNQLNGQIYLYWGGSPPDSTPDMIITRPGIWEEGYQWFGTRLYDLGDFNGDGYDDLLANPFESGDTVTFLYFGGPDIDTIPDVVFPRRCSRVHPAGDINQDGYMDIITSYSSSWPSLGEVNIYFGGPDADSLRDMLVRNSDMPEWQEYFGQACAAIGDFNGDGRNDFAFSAIRADHRGEVYIFSGPEPITDVGYDYEPSLPSGFTLSQNYPNPFNPTTTIEFDVPRRAQVSLSIYNVLGQEVWRLIDGPLSAGTYRLQWDGRLSSGQPAGSGVYIYRLTSGDITLSRKMVLLR